MSRLLARGKFLYDGEQKFYVRGVSYGPFPPNSRGERYPEPERTAQDFALMRAMGVNTVRVYVPPPDWMFEEAAKAGLRLMVGIPWPFHMAFLDTPGMAAEIRETIRSGVAAMRKHEDSILAFSLGNEIRSDIVRWHGPRKVSRFLSELYDIGKQLAPEALFTYSNYPSAEYLDLTFLDFVSFNVYLHREEDFRRYLTHLMGITAECPLVLSETGMDTIREGEQHQADLLSWQGRAAFESGLSGFIVFAFTDEWHTGGSEITDWAFGLVRKDRTPKIAFDAMKQVYAASLPPPLPAAPKVSVVVAAFNAAATIGACLESLRSLNYPDYETIVVDDGSTDSTAEMAEQGGARVVKIEHRGLGAARNEGARSASGEIVAYLDADACADRDWLYFLVETIVRRNAAAAGGPNFAPEPVSATAAALACAPGLPREVRAGDDRLSQLCGCNMAIRKSALEIIGGFDEMFTTAGDDTDLSWRMTAANKLLAYAPSAVVIHERRATIKSYLVQQRGYGVGEGLLYLKYPLRKSSDTNIYAGSSWLAPFLSRARVYYGAFGRGLFQTVYSSGPSILEVPLTAPWVITSVAFLLGWLFGDRTIFVLGAAGVITTLLALSAFAAIAPLRKEYSGPYARFVLGVATILGSLRRSWSRTWGRPLRFKSTPDERSRWKPRLKNQLRLEPTSPGAPLDSMALMRELRQGLISRGLAVAESDGYQAYDLRILRQFAAVDVNCIREANGIRLTSRGRMVWRSALSAYAVLLLIDLIVAFNVSETLAAIVGMMIVVVAALFVTSMLLNPVIASTASAIAPSLEARVVEDES